MDRVAAVGFFIFLLKSTKYCCWLLSNKPAMGQSGIFRLEILLSYFVVNFVQSTQWSLIKGSFPGGWFPPGYKASDVVSYIISIEHLMEQQSRRAEGGVLEGWGLVGREGGVIGFPTGSASTPYIMRYIYLTSNQLTYFITFASPLLYDLLYNKNH